MKRLRNSVDLSCTVERLGFHRHWVAEHHNMPGIASAAPAVLIAHLAALTKAQRDKTTFAVDDPEWRKWMNQHFYVRQGVSFLEMTDGAARRGDSGCCAPR